MADAAESTALLNGLVLPAWFGPDNFVRFQVVSVCLFVPRCAEPAVVLPYVFGLTVLGVVPRWWDLAVHVLTIWAFGAISSCRWSDDPLVNQTGKAGRAGIQQQDRVFL